MVYKLHLSKYAFKITPSILVRLGNFCYCLWTWHFLKTVVQDEILWPTTSFQLSFRNLGLGGRGSSQFIPILQTHIIVNCPSLCFNWTITPCDPQPSFLWQEQDLSSLLEHCPLFHWVSIWYWDMLKMTNWCKGQ